MRNKIVGREQLWPRPLRLCRRFKWIQSAFGALKASAGCQTLLGWALWSPAASSADWLRSVILGWSRHKLLAESCDHLVLHTVCINYIRAGVMDVFESAETESVSPAPAFNIATFNLLVRSRSFITKEEKWDVRCWNNNIKKRREGEVPNFQSSFFFPRLRSSSRLLITSPRKLPESAGTWIF